MTKKKYSEKEADLIVTTTLLDRKAGEQQKSRQKKIKIRPFLTETATVSVKYGATIPTEPYANVRVDVMVTCPCYVEEVEDVWKQVRKMVDRMTDAEVARLTDEAGEA